MQYVYLNIIDFYKNCFCLFLHTQKKKNHNIPLYNTFNLFNKKYNCEILQQFKIIF